jgi:Coenzyme F420-dependent N5,N10-methylene tetrahydromethanopterin reductase and related flavin-dependent oxidoreductases
MRTATTIEASSGKDAVEFAVEAERLGLDVCWVAEAWGADAPSPLGYLAARTERMLLGSGVIQIGTRSPVTIAQTAMTLAPVRRPVPAGSGGIGAPGDGGAARRPVRPSTGPHA